MAVHVTDPKEQKDRKRSSFMSDLLKKAHENTHVRSSVPIVVRISTVILNQSSTTSSRIDTSLLKLYERIAKEKHVQNAKLSKSKFHGRDKKLKNMNHRENESAIRDTMFYSYLKNQQEDIRKAKIGSLKF